MGRRRKIRFRISRQTAIALGILALSVGVAGWLQQQADDTLLTPEGLRQAIDRAGWLGPLIYISVLALAVVISQLPNIPLAMAAGAIWGPAIAGIYSVLGGFLGGLIAYFLGKTLGRSMIKALTGKVIYFSKQKGEAYLGWLIFITRLLPIFSFDLVSYGAGITGLSLPVYSISTLLGMIPSTFLLTYIGATLTVSPSQGIAFTVIFLLVLIGLPWLIQRYNWFGLKGVIRIE